MLSWLSFTKMFYFRNKFALFYTHTLLYPCRALPNITKKKILRSFTLAAFTFEGISQSHFHMETEREIYM